MKKKIWEKFEAHTLSLSLKFLLGIFFIIILFSGLLSALFYFYLKVKILNSYYEKMNLLFTQLEATGKFIQRDLRPFMLNSLQKGFKKEVSVREDLIFNALSTTKVRKLILKYFNEKYPQIKYERVSFYPINPENKINDFHSYILSKFTKKTSTSLWRGIIKWEKEELLIIARPIYAESACLLCHGKINVMPQILLTVYKPSQDFPWEEGDMMGIELISYPVKEALTEIKNTIISIYTISLLAMVILIISLEGIFYALNVKPLKQLQRHFLAIKTGKATLDNPLLVKRKDEIGELFNSFNELSYHLYTVQNSLNESLKTLETLFESITQPIALLSKNGIPEITNQVFKNFKNKENFKELIKKVFEEKKVHQELITSQDGKYYQLSLYPVFDEKGEVIKVVQLIEDITEQKKMEEQLILTEKLAAVGHLAAGLAHEINNPLSGLLLMVKNLQKNYLSEQEKTYHLNLMESALHRIQRIIKDLLNFSRSSELRPEKISINQLLEEVLELSSYLIKKENIKVIKDFEPSLPEICVDPEKMEQVFLNLLLNAIQAMENSEDKTLTIKTFYQGEKVFISFQDTGPGIPEEFVTKIFDPFFTTKPPGRGTGLGLTVSLAIVKNHRGNLLLEKHKGGAIFTIELPIAFKK